MRILLVEDDLLFGDGICVGLCLEGDIVEWVIDGVVVENVLVIDEFDLLVFDIGLLCCSGLDILCNLCYQGWFILVLLFIVWDKVVDWVVGFDSGVDDYLIKFFDFDELQVWVCVLICCIIGCVLL